MSTKIKIGLGVLIVIIAGGVLIFFKTPQITTYKPVTTPVKDTAQTNNTTEIVNTNTNGATTVTTIKTVTTTTTTTTTVTTKPTTSANKGDVVVDTTPKETTYTMSEVSKHDSKSDCWTTVNGKVYNVTSWISEHPGGAEAIISLCGIDGSEAFNEQHGGQRRPEQELAGFFIGKLK